jgi:DNA-directed RNA polymerase specialized sigma24 family protein
MLTPLDQWFAAEILPLEGTLVRYLSRVWPNSAEVPDLRQDIYIRVYESARRGFPHSPRAYLFKTARNLMADRVRRARIVHIDSNQDFEVLNVLIDEISPERRLAARRELQSRIALAEEAASQPDKADAILMTGRTSVDCYRFRADILDHRGDWVGAQKTYADAVALAPDLPAGYYSWGVAFAKHGDLAGAQAKLKGANDRGPHWADPLKAWGDVLVKQGKNKEALERYDEALQYAPNWKQLKEAREAAAK